MAEDVVPEDTVIVVDRRPIWVRIAKWVAIALGVVLALIVALIVGLNTSPGKRFLANQLGAYTTASGINIRVGEIEGSIYSHMILHGLEIRDQQGVFITSPLVDIRWHPFAYIHSKIDLDSVTATGASGDNVFTIGFRYDFSWRISHK